MLANVGPVSYAVAANGAMAAAAPVTLDALLDDLFTADLNKDPIHIINLANGLILLISPQPGQKQALVDALAQRYWKEGGGDPKHRPLMAELIRNASLSGEVGAALDKLAAQNPQDATLNAQHDIGGNQTTLSAGDEVRGTFLPSIFPDRNAFDAALGVLNPYLNSPEHRYETRGSFSTETVKTVAQMALDDPRWTDDSIFGSPIPIEHRHTIQEAAATVRLPKNASVVAEIVGPDGLFKDAAVKAWRNG